MCNQSSSISCDIKERHIQCNVKIKAGRSEKGAPHYPLWAYSLNSHISNKEIGDTFFLLLFIIDKNYYKFKYNLEHKKISDKIILYAFEI